MSVLKKLKIIYFCSWTINIDIVLQMFFLPVKCVNLFALWKSSPFILFSIYYFLLYFNTMTDKDMSSKYIDGKTIGLYYIDVLLKIVEMIFGFIFVNNMRDTDNEIIGIIIQTIFFTLDFIIQISVICKYKNIFSISKDNRKTYLIDYRSVECTNNDVKQCNYLILILLAKVFVLDNAVVICCFLKVCNLIFFILLLNIISDLLIDKIWKSKNSDVIRQKIKKSRISLLYILEVIYNIFGFFLIRELSFDNGVIIHRLLIIGYIVYVIFFDLQIFIPLIKLNICMDKYLQKKGEIR